MAPDYVTRALVYCYFLTKHVRHISQLTCSCISLCTGEKPYHCTNDGCGKSFTASHHLKNHQVTHSDQRFPCELDSCDARFSTKQLLLSHVQAAHHNPDDDMSVDPNIFTEDIMTSLLQAPVQTGEGQSMSLTDIMQQWSNPVSMPMVSSGTPQCTTIEQPSLSSPRSQSLLSELVRDLASPAVTTMPAQSHSIPSSTPYEQLSNLSQFSSVSSSSSLPQPMTAGPSSSSQTQSAPLSFNSTKEVSQTIQLVNALTTLQNLQNSGVLQDLLSATSVLNSFTNQQLQQQPASVGTAHSSLVQQHVPSPGPSISSAHSAVAQQDVPSLSTAQSALVQQHLPLMGTAHSPVIPPAGTTHSSLAQQHVPSPVMASVQPASEHAGLLYQDHTQSSSAQQFSTSPMDLTNNYFDDSGTQTLPVDLDALLSVPIPAEMLVGTDFSQALWPEPATTSHQEMNATSTAEKSTATSSNDVSIQTDLAFDCCAGSKMECCSSCCCMNNTCGHKR